MPSRRVSVEKQAELFSVLSDPTRLKILKLLSAREGTDALCVNGLAFRLGITQSAVSQHLRILKSAEMVKSDKRGNRVHYFIDREKISYYFQVVRSFFCDEIENTEC